jgi:LacI family transcriptional regulator
MRSFIPARKAPQSFPVSFLGHYATADYSPKRVTSDDVSELADDDQPRRPTMHDVAALAGVALSSVSRALGNHPDVSKRMRRRVLEAANELGYEPNFLAQSLRTGSTQAVGFVVRDIANPFFATIANGAERYLRERGYVMLLVNSDGDPDIDASHINVLRRRRVDGLILSIAAEDHQPTLDALAGMRSPIVLVDRELPDLDVSAVLCDHYNGVRAATEDLIAHGHRRIALITGPSNVRPVRERVRGMSAALAAHGIDDDPALVNLGAFGGSFPYDSMSALLDAAEPPTAVLTGGVQVTLGAMRALSHRNLTPGEDIGFVALDELDMLEIARPALSVVTRDPHRIGAEAARLLLAAAAGEPAQRIVLPTEYHRRTTPTVDSPAG